MQLMRVVLELSSAQDIGTAGNSLLPLPGAPQISVPFNDVIERYRFPKVWVSRSRVLDKRRAKDPASGEICRESCVHYAPLVGQVMRHDEGW